MKNGIEIMCPDAVTLSGVEESIASGLCFKYWFMYQLNKFIQTLFERVYHTVYPSTPLRMTVAGLRMTVTGLRVTAQ